MTSRSALVAAVACAAALASCASQPSPRSVAPAREEARADPAPKVGITAPTQPTSSGLALPASKYLHGSEHIKCGELPFPGVVYQRWHDVNCWYLFYVVHGRDEPYSLIAGKAPHGGGELLYNRANGAIAVASMPADCAPRIANVRPPLVDISCGVDTPAALFDLRSGSISGQ